MNAIHYLRAIVSDPAIVAASIPIAQEAKAFLASLDAAPAIAARFIEIERLAIEQEKKNRADGLPHTAGLWEDVAEAHRRSPLPRFATLCALEEVKKHLLYWPTLPPGEDLYADATRAAIARIAEILEHIPCDKNSSDASDAK